MKVRNYMAILRNMRNILDAHVSKEHMEKVIAAISDPTAVKKSKQLPFRFLSAYKELPTGCGSKVYDALENAVDASIENLPKLDGTTVIAIDVSGSMSTPLSVKSSVNCSEIATLLGLIANRICDNAIVYKFNYDIKEEGLSSRVGVLHEACNARCGGGTDMSLPFAKMLRDRVKADRIIILSDNECNRVSNRYYREPVQTIADKYRKQSGCDIWVHAIDLMGYGTQQFCGAKTNIVAGWSEKVFEFITLAEQGEGTLEKTIAEYKY